MKRVCLIIGTLVAIANAFANNGLVSSTSNLANAAEAAVYHECENCTLDFGKASKVVILDNAGHVVFYNENIASLDLSNWEHGQYIAKVNDNETIKFTL